MNSDLLAFFLFFFFFAAGQTNWLKTKDPWGSAKTLALNYYWKTHQYPWPVAGWFLSTRFLGWKFCHAQLVRNNKANSGESCANKLILLSLPRPHRLFIHYPGEGNKKNLRNWSCCSAESQTFWPTRGAQKELAGMERMERRKSATRQVQELGTSALPFPLPLSPVYRARFTLKIRPLLCLLHLSAFRANAKQPPTLNSRISESASRVAN